mmetsp:Transcript_18876/g.23224  ORF Transcript_18876/g.23224 Transcript_18876/m.23224 type:complete len:259 (+) Transcript_18876:132-908(+)
MSVTIAGLGVSVSMTSVVTASTDVDTDFSTIESFSLLLIFTTVLVVAAGNSGVLISTSAVVSTADTATASSKVSFSLLLLVGFSLLSIPVVAFIFELFKLFRYFVSSMAILLVLFISSFSFSISLFLRKLYFFRIRLTKCVLSVVVEASVVGADAGADSVFGNSILTAAAGVAAGIVGPSVPTTSVGASADTAGIGSSDVSFLASSLLSAPSVRAFPFELSKLDSYLVSNILSFSSKILGTFSLSLIVTSSSSLSLLF